MLIMVLTSVSCKSNKKVTETGKSLPSQTSIIHVGKPDKTGRRIISEAMTWLGTPYAYAGSEKGEGTDCSGMVMKVYEDVTGCKLPRNSAKQAEFCLKLEPKDVEVGDLVFFATGKDPHKISHVGIVIDDRTFIHASTSKGVVISEIYTPYYKRTFRMFGRVP